VRRDGRRDSSVSSRCIVNSEDIAALKRKDGVFELIGEKYGDPPDWRREAGFVSLSRIILEQQLSLSSANAHFLKLSSYVKEFSPAEISRLSDEEMRSCQISRQKAVYLRELAGAVLERRIVLEDLEAQDIELTRSQLMGIKGIGQWTVDIYSMFCLQEKDIFPFGDLAAMKAARELKSGLSDGELRSLSETWRPLRSLAAYYFWLYYLGERKRPLVLGDRSR